MHLRVHVQKIEALRKIAFFDFDGTVTTHDTLLEFIRHRKGTARFYIGFLLNSPFIVAYKIGLISNQFAKEQVLRYFFGRTLAEKFQQYCDEFADKEIPRLLRQKALHEILQLQQKGFEVVIVSASAENWIRNWCKSINVSLLASRLEIRNEKITGRLIGKNCHGEEKVRRIREMYQLAEYSSIYCYGDTNGDKPMLALGHHSFYKPFR